MSKRFDELGTARMSNAAFAELQESLLREVKTTGAEVLKVTKWATDYETQVTVMDMLVKRQTSYIETPRIAQLDVVRDAWWKCFWHTLEFLLRLPETDELRQHVVLLYRMATPYKGMHERALLEQSKDMDSFLDLATSATEKYAESIQKVGLTTAVREMMKANVEMHTEMSARQNEMAERIAKYSQMTTDEVRQRLVETWGLITQRVEAVVNLSDEAETVAKCEAFIDKVNAILYQFRLMLAHQGASRKDDEPQPEPETAPEQETNGGTGAA